jgi:hypothetical protein
MVVKHRSKRRHANAQVEPVVKSTLADETRKAEWKELDRVMLVPLWKLWSCETMEELKALTAHKPWQSEMLECLKSLMGDK